MKLKLAAAVVLASVSSLSFAEALNPQPSFRDSAEISSYGRGAPEAQRDFPRPSFDDAAPIRAEGVATSTDLRPAAELIAAFPQPSSVAN